MTVNIARSLAWVALAFVLTTVAIGLSVSAVQAAGWTIDPDGGGN